MPFEVRRNISYARTKGARDGKGLENGLGGKDREMQLLRLHEDQPAARDA